MAHPGKPVHGGLDPHELQGLGLNPEDVLDFSASLNPIGPPPEIVRAMAGVDAGAYPDRTCAALREALSDRLGVPPDHILVGNGSSELIHLLAWAYLGPRRTAVVLGPTFSEYEAAAERTGAAVFRYDAKEGEGFVRPLAPMFGFIRLRRAELVFLCNPNNPTGVHFSQGKVLHIGSAVGHTGLMVLDEAYHGLADERWDATGLLKIPNVVLLRSMTKDFAIPGVRLGYLVARPSVVERVASMQPSWSVSAFSQAAGLAALDLERHVEAGREAVREAKAYLYREIADMGLNPLPSSANFFLVKAGDASHTRRELLKRGVNVRDCTSFGLPEHIRIGVRRVEDCRRLVEAIREVTNHG